MGVADEARDRIAREFGRAFARKITDRLAVNCWPSTPPTDGDGLRMVIELTPQDVEAAPGRSSREAWESVSRALRAQGVTGSGPVAGALLRRPAIERHRDAFFRRHGATVAEIERRTRRASAVRVCWLSSRVEVSAAPADVAPFADRDVIERFDCPLPVRSEISETRGRVGATEFAATNSVRGLGVIVAVLDGEIKVDHPAFGDRVFHRLNFTGESWGLPSAHGTRVAGIIGADGVIAGGGSSPMLGMAPAATLYNYKVLRSDEAVDPTDFDCALALQHALEDGAHVANLSLGVDGLSIGNSGLTVACNNAWKLGMVIVKSAGNMGTFGGITVPGDADGIIVVGATDRRAMAVEDYSSRGPIATGELRPHLVAPGGNRNVDAVLSCNLLDGFSGVGEGTSFAAAHVSGLVALMLEHDPLMTPDEVRAELIATAHLERDDIAEIVGAGRVKLRS